MNKTLHVQTQPLSQRRYRVVLYGLGPIGVLTGKLAAAKDWIDLVGAVDIDPAKVGQDLGKLLEQSEPMGVAVTDDAQGLLEATRPDVVLHMTSSYIDQFAGQIKALAQAGANVASSSEELFYPYLRGAAAAAEIDDAAKAAGVTVLGTGVNPGFVMDVFPIVISGVCRDVTRVRVERIVDAATRRMPLQRKVGVGIDRDEFERRAEEGQFGHVGLAESVAFLAEALGWRLDTITEVIEPMVADHAFSTEFFRVEAGKVTGLHQVAQGLAKGDALIELELSMYAGAPQTQDVVTLTGDPDLQVTVRGGTPGDVATPAALVNAIPRVVAAEPGLKTMRDIAMPAAAVHGPVRVVRAD